MQLNHFDIEAAIVDLDGTLVDTLGDFCLALNLMLADLPEPYCRHRVDRSSIAHWVGKGSEHLIRQVLARIQVAGAELESDAGRIEALYPSAWASYERHYPTINGQQSVTFAGVEGGLRHLRARGLKLACLTNKPTAFAKELLRLKGLDGYFECVFGGDAFERRKPDPLPLLKTCEALGSAPRRTLMIGDSSNDAQAARAAGCPVLLVTYGYNHGLPVRSVDADAFVDSLESLAELPGGVASAAD
jgi:phosphoglycolate phosphatase